MLGIKGARKVDALTIDELLASDVKGCTPFKDLRVRRAIYQAIDIEPIIKQVRRSQASATGSFMSRPVDGHLPELERRLPHDPAAARALLAQAGYPNGVSTNLDCVNVSYRAAACHAVTSMLTRVGIKVNFVASPSSIFFPKLTQATGNFLEYSWSPGTDPWVMLNALVRSTEGGNAGRYSNQKLDVILDDLQRNAPELARRGQI